MPFLHDYERWLEHHLRSRTGERKQRIAEGLRHAEKEFVERVWYPAFRSLNDLHPEYEITDFKNGARFLDFAYIRPPLRLAIEIDGYSTHASQASRWQFSDSLMRQNHLVVDGWHVLRFSYDDIAEKPRSCEQVLQQFMGVHKLDAPEPSSIRQLMEEEVLRLTKQLNRPLRPEDVIGHLRVGRRTAQRILLRMLKEGLLLPAGKGTQKIRGYKPNPEHAGH